MRKIAKEIPAKSFTDFIRRNKKATWEQFPPIERHEATELLAKEQLSLDGYTERLLKINDRNTHIDHFRKRSLFPKLTFDWENLILAEHSTEFGADAKDNFSKFRVRNKEDYQNIVDPVHDEPHDFLKGYNYPSVLEYFCSSEIFYML